MLPLLAGAFILTTTFWPLYFMKLSDLKELIRFIQTGQELWPGGPPSWLLLTWVGAYALTGVWLTARGARGCLRLARHRA